MLLRRLWSSAALIARIVLIMVLTGFVLPRLISCIAELLFPLRSLIATRADQPGDINADAGLSAYWRLVAWLRHFYVGGD